MLHRDLKPANILVGADLEPKLLDFGLALDLGVHERLSGIGEMAGTPEYFSPEQARGAARLDARSDVFSLGAVLYELLAGAPPFRGETWRSCCGSIREQEPALPRRQNPADPQRPAGHLPEGSGKRSRRTATVRRAKWPTTCAAFSPAKPCWPSRPPMRG
jgi:serine/threonine protein kinase